MLVVEWRFLGSLVWRFCTFAPTLTRQTFSLDLRSPVYLSRSFALICHLKNIFIRYFHYFSQILKIENEVIIISQSLIKNENTKVKTETHCRLDIFKAEIPTLAFHKKTMDDFNVHCLTHSPIKHIKLPN